MSESDQNLAQKALLKRKAGESLTKSEERALAEALESRLAEMLRDIRPKFFNDLFGIQNLQRNQWEETLKIPCGRGRDSINLFEVCSAIRGIFSKRGEIAAGSAGAAELKIKKLEAEIEKLNNQNVATRTENELMARERLPRALIMSRLDRLAAIIRGVGDDLSRKSRLTGEEAQRQLNFALDQYARELSAIEQL